MTVTTSNYNGTSLSYQWKKGNDNYSDGTDDNILNLSNLTENASYSVVVTAHIGNCTSTPVVKSVDVKVLNPSITVPNITANPSTTICKGDNTTQGFVWIQYVQPTIATKKNVTCNGGDDGEIKITIPSNHANGTYYYTVTGTTSKSETSFSITDSKKDVTIGR